eukprot:2935188-Pyramimonas_sp.AAC.1
MLKQHGIDATHFRESTRSLRKKRAREDSEGDNLAGVIPAGSVEEAKDGDCSWLMSVTAVLAWLWDCVSRGFAWK